mmetsp:Transcript_6125/g.7050  ORF Transcript_6125/g.7050 Transcript_6125/m.7050 type:complete len:230 (+) Transcript_6125:2372-3061(+)
MPFWIDFQSVPCFSINSFNLLSCLILHPGPPERALDFFSLFAVVFALLFSRPCFCDVLPTPALVLFFERREDATPAFFEDDVVSFFIFAGVPDFMTRLPDLNEFAMCAAVFATILAIWPSSSSSLVILTLRDLNFADKDSISKSSTAGFSSLKNSSPVLLFVLFNCPMGILSSRFVAGLRKDGRRLRPVLDVPFVNVLEFIFVTCLFDEVLLAASFDVPFFSYIATIGE